MEEKDLMLVLEDLLKSDGYIQTNKLLIRKFGLHEAVLLGELMSERSYWRSKGKLIEDEWFYSTRENLEYNTGLSPYYQRQAIESFEQLGILESKQIGMPSKLYYRIVDGLLLKALMACRESLSRQDVKGFNDMTEKALTQINNKEKEINNQNIQKRPAGPAVVGSSKRNFRADTLKDSLSSGKEIDTQQKRKKEKTPLNEECLDEIERDSYGFDSITKQLLVQYIAFITDTTVRDARRVKNLKSWQKKLTSLLELSNSDNILMQKIIKQSLDNKWYKFVEYEQPITRSTYRQNKATNDNLGMQTMTPDEAQAELDRRIASGVKAY